MAREGGREGGRGREEGKEREKERREKGRREKGERKEREKEELSYRVSTINEGELWTTHCQSTEEQNAVVIYLTYLHGRIDHYSDLFGLQFMYEGLTIEDYRGGLCSPLPGKRCAVECKMQSDEW